MTHSSPGTGAEPLPTRLSLAQLRAENLHRLLLRRRDVRKVAAIYGCSELFTWPRRQIEQAVDYLVADGRLSEDAHGRLIVRRIERGT